MGHARLWPLFAVFAALLIVALMVRAGGGNRPVFQQEGLLFDGIAGEENVVVTPPFQVEGRLSPLRVAVGTNVSNNWAAFEMTLVDEASGRTREFSREVGYYDGIRGRRALVRGVAQAAP